MGEGGRFCPHYQPTGRRVLAQVSGGLRLTIDVDDGHPVSVTPTQAECWPQPPLSLGRGHTLVVAAARRLEVVDTDSGVELWSHAADAPGITLSPPQVWGDTEKLFRLTDGWRLEELDPTDGRTRAKVMLATQPVALSRSAFDREYLYFVTDNVLHAHALTGRRRSWETALATPGRTWRVTLARGWLFAFPTTDGGSAETADVPVYVCDPADGRLVQRMSFAAGPGPRQFQVNGSGAVAVSGDRLIGLTFAGPVRAGS
jgi:hypothetical protein